MFSVLTFPPDEVGCPERGGEMLLLPPDLVRPHQQLHRAGGAVAPVHQLLRAVPRLLHLPHGGGEAALAGLGAHLGNQ